MWRSTTPFLASMLVSLIAATTSAEEHTKDSLQTIKENIAAKKAVLVDVRDREEWNMGHVEGAIFSHGSN